MDLLWIRSPCSCMCRATPEYTKYTSCTFRQRICTRTHPVDELLNASINSGEFLRSAATSWGDELFEFDHPDEDPDPVIKAAWCKTAAKLAGVAAARARMRDTSGSESDQVYTEPPSRGIPAAVATDAAIHTTTPLSRPRLQAALQMMHTPAEEAADSSLSSRTQEQLPSTPATLSSRGELPPARQPVRIKQRRIRSRPSTPPSPPSVDAWSQTALGSSDSLSLADTRCSDPNELCEVRA